MTSLVHIAGLVACIYAGVKLGVWPAAIRWRMLAAATVAVAAAHALVLVVLPHEVAHWTPDDGPLDVLGAGAAITAGFSGPALFVPWAGLTTRAHTALLLVGAGLETHRVHAFSDVVLIMNDALVPPPDYPFEQDMLLSVLFLGGIGYAVGRLERQRRRRLQRR
jgi:hypothetical protein